MPALSDELTLVYGWNQSPPFNYKSTFEFKTLTSTLLIIYSLFISLTKSICKNEVRSFSMIISFIEMKCQKIELFIRLWLISHNFALTELWAMWLGGILVRRGIVIHILFQGENKPVIKFRCSEYFILKLLFGESVSFNSQSSQKRWMFKQKANFNEFILI